MAEERKKLAQWLSYWRNSLADAEGCKGSFSQQDVKDFIKVPTETIKKLTSIALPSSEQNTLFHKAVNRLFQGEKSNVSVIKIAIYSRIYLSKHQHAKYRSGALPDIITPVRCSAWVTRKGQLYPAGITTIPRDLLAPQAVDRFTLATTDELDKFLTLYNPLSRALSKEQVIAMLSDKAAQEKDFWRPYYKLTDSLFTEVGQTNDSKLTLEKHYLLDDGVSYIQKVGDDANAALHILALYDHLEHVDSDLSLAGNYAFSNTSTYQPCVNALSNIVSRLGHSNNNFPLAEAQRDALAQTLSMQEGEILPVNGPPGTGKTTFVLSVVASLWVEAALEEADPPLIVAASTNNQAVTNIIDAFGKDFSEGSGAFSGRWLPNISSYGGYFPATSREKEAAKIYQTASFYKDLEHPEKFEGFKHFLLQKARAAFQDNSLNDLHSVKTKLLDELKAHKRILTRVEIAWLELSERKKRCLNTLGDDPLAIWEALSGEIHSLQEQVQQVSQDLSAWQDFCINESVWLSLFNWLPAIRRKQALTRKRWIETNVSSQTQNITTGEPSSSVDTYLTSWIEKQNAVLAEKQKTQMQWQALIDDWQHAEKHWYKLGRSISLDLKPPFNLEDLDRTLDITVRFTLFRLAVHYWEVRWLLACKEHEKVLRAESSSGRPKTGIKSVIPRWQRRMMLTPCIVSTFHALPAHMTHSVHEGEQKWSTQYLLNHIDLLIVDEAGQVSPEVAGASFALAKKALVIGDIHQIEPVQTLTRMIDAGNLRQSHLLQDPNEYADVCETGRSAVNGSVMHVAQQASQYHYLSQGEPGMYLREHRRCYDDIISFCNQLCYQGLLIPKRGAVEHSDAYSGFKYLHIDGYAETGASGSRLNRLEASTIVAWLAEHRETLEKLYKAKLEDVVAVITPFKAQESQIKSECSRQDITTGKGQGKMTVGTVHALQGAERKLIIFSPVYSRHADGKFIDSRASMLNVAVSRAKDGFMVFGDMDVIAGAAAGSPRQVLAQYLFSHKNNELVFKPNLRADLLKVCTKPQLINNASMHDAYIKQLLEGAQMHIDMVSPWISLARLRETGLHKLMIEKAKRGIKVTVYTDLHFNTTIGNCYNKGKEIKLQQACAELSSHGIDVLIVRGVHSKIIMVDSKYMLVGSYNWANAARTGKYANMETFFVYKGNLHQETTLQIKALKNRVVQPFIAEAISNNMASRATASSLSFSQKINAQ